MSKVPDRYHRALTDGEKAAIMIMRGKHMSLESIAEQINRKPNTVKMFLMDMAKLAATSGIEYDFKDDLKMKSIDAVRAGLDDDRDNYKRASIGVNVLKGIGVFAQDGVQINQLIASVPPEWANRYLHNDEVVHAEQGSLPEESAARIG